MKAALDHKVGAASWKAILLVVAESCHMDGTGCTLRYQTIAERAECSLATVKRAIPAMVAAGVLHGRAGALSVEMNESITIDPGVTTTPKRAHSDTKGEEAPDSQCDQPASPRDPAGVTVTPPSEPTKNRPTTDPVGKSRKKPSTSVPDLFPVTPELREWARTHAPSIDVDLETANWLDHHRAKGSRFSDWTAAWRTWMRNAQKWSRKPAAQTGPRSRITFDRSEPSGRLAL